MLANRLLFGKKDLPLPNLTGASKWEENTVYSPGTYKVTIRSGACYHPTLGMVGGVGFTQTVTVNQKFFIRAYCGAAANSAASGTNPYSGTYKRNASLTSAIPSNGGIFGGPGGTRLISSTSGTPQPGGCNCLGDGQSQGTYHNGAGSCCHFIPVDGTFGTNYLFCFHCAGSTCIGGGRGANWGASGGGGAYGGGGGAARSMTPTAHYGYGYAGGAGAGGNGGSGGGTSTSAGGTAGGKGGGVGGGDGGKYLSSSSGGQIAQITPTYAGVAFYNGSTWSAPSKTTHSLTGCIIVEKV